MTKRLFKLLLLCSLVAIATMAIIEDSPEIGGGKPPQEITLPMVGTGWVLVNDLGISVLELEHGWLAWRREGRAGGLTYIPKPPYGR